MLFEMLLERELFADHQKTKARCKYVWKCVCESENTGKKLSHTG